VPAGERREERGEGGADDGNKNTSIWLGWLEPQVFMIVVMRSARWPGPATGLGMMTTVTEGIAFVVTAWGCCDGGSS